MQRLATPLTRRRSTCSTPRPSRRWWAASGALVAAAALAASAAAADIAPPPGFALSAKLSAPVAFVAGKSASVYCAATMQDFNAADKQYTGLVYGAGFSQIGGDQTFLATWVCSYLNRWLAKKPVTRYHLAAALGVLTHEAEIEKGVKDESLADCAGLAVMPQVVRRFFPLRGVYTMHDLMHDAWVGHGRQPPEYLTNCPPR